MTVYDVCIALSKSESRIIVDGKRCGKAKNLLFDLDEKTIFCNKEKIVEQGKVMVDSIELSNGDGWSIKEMELITYSDDFYNILYELFEQYMSSSPSRHDSFVKSNFKALSSDELTFTQIKNNMPRNEARVRLEAFILLSAMAGKSYWNNPKHFYWKSLLDDRLIVLKQWVAL